MSQLLSDSNIKLLENFIASNKPCSSDLLPAVSECYRVDAINYWKVINEPETLPTTYLQFAYSGYGMSSYAFYKTKDGLIFMINSFCNELTAYYNVTSSWNILIPPDIYLQTQSDLLLYVDDKKQETVYCSTS